MLTVEKDGKRFDVVSYFGVLYVAGYYYDNQYQPYPRWRRYNEKQYGKLSINTSPEWLA